MTVPELIAAIERAEFADLVREGSPRFPELMDKAANLFEQYELGDQALAYALLFGMLIGSCEGLTCDMDKTAGKFLTYEDRLAIFKAQAVVACKGAMAVAADPACPHPLDSVQ